MGGGESCEVHHYHTNTVYQVPPETQAKLGELTKSVAEFEEEAIRQGDPNLFTENSDKIFDTFVNALPDMKLTEFIKKDTGDVHVGVLGNISVGKSTLLNTLFKLQLPTALGHITTECKMVHRSDNPNDRTFYWDVPGNNSDYRFYKPENLSFLKSLDTIILLFDSDINTIKDVLRVITVIKAGTNDQLLVLRTKVDQHTSDDNRSIEEEKALDQEKLSAISSTAKLYYVSCHNIKNNREPYDWNDFKNTIL